MGCCQPVLAPIENYYTKYQVDKLIESAVTSGCCITPEEVDEKIEEAISGITVSGVTQEELDEAIASAKTQIEAEIPTVPTKVSAFENDVPYLTEHQSLSGYATEQWVLDKHYITGVDLSNYATKSEIPVVPTNVSAFNNDAGYLTEHQSLSGYVTNVEMSAFTYDKATIDEKVAGGGTFDPTQYYTKTATNALLDEKLDVTAYTPTDLSNYYNKQEVNNIVESAKTEIEAEIPTVPTNVSAFNNDAGYLTEHQSLSGYATEQWVENKHYITGVDLSDYATTQWVEDQHYITGVDLSDYALKSEIPVVPTNVSAFNNDAGYLTEHQSLSAYSTTSEVATLISQSVSGKVDTSTYTAYTASTQTTINSKADSSTLNNYLLKSKIWCGTQNEFDSIQNKDSETLYLIHE